jgi:hypothetical protein
MLTLFFAATALFGQAQQAPDPAATLRRLISQNRHFLSMENGHLRGEGAEFLLGEAKNAQFVALGEYHFNRDIPAITTALFRDLQERYGFGYLALENSVLATRMLNEKPYRGNLSALVDFDHRYPYATTFDSDQELSMIADVGKTSRAKGRPIWGLDQEFGATYVLDHLRDRARTGTARAAVDTLRAKVAPLEATRTNGADGSSAAVHYLSQLATAEEMEALRRGYAPAPGSFEEFAIRQLALSQEIYSYFHRTEGEPVGRLNNYVREENMKSLFMDEYRNAQRKGDALPKVVLKFGQWHLYRGLGPGGVFTLGNFLTEFAKSNEMKSLHVHFLVFNPGDKLEKDSEWMAPFLESADPKQWTLIDLRPMLNYRHAGLLPAGNATLVRTLYGYDFLFLIPSYRKATFRLTRGEAE